MRILLLITLVTFGCLGAVKTDTLKAKGNVLVVKDTTKFLKPIQAAVAEIDSFVGDIKIESSTNTSFIELNNTSTSSVAQTGFRARTIGSGTYNYTAFGRFTGAYSFGGGYGYIWNADTGGILFGANNSEAARLKGNGDFSVAGTVTAPSLQLGTGDLLSVYDTGSFACSLFDNTTYRASVIAKYTVIGNVLTLHIPQLSGSITSGAAQITGIPEVFYPRSQFFYVPLVVISNGAKQAGLLYKQGAEFPFYARTGADGNLASGAGGIAATSVSWTID